MLIVNEYKKDVMSVSRKKKLEHFYSLSQPGESVLDAGVSEESGKGLPARNYFLKNYQYSPETYTGLGVENLTSLKKLFPGKHFVQYPGRKFPFPNKEFDWVHSNAVIEHVGDEQAQLLFLNEMMRVAKNVFFTTPNKYFPVESHTNVFFLHWYNNLFYKWCQSNQPWVNQESLYLFSLRRLHSLLESSNAVSYSIQNNRLLGLPMTFTVVCTDNSPG